MPADGLFMLYNICEVRMMTGLDFYVAVLSQRPGQT